MKDKLTQRPPVVAVVGHIDHGKSTLLDYIRKSNIVGKESGHITQHIGAYEIFHTDNGGLERKITFIDTPGHEAFSEMRTRGAKIADIIILMVAADDGVNVQTKESIKTIKNAGVPFLVAINKIDLPAANIEKTKQDLVTNEVYLEGYGGDIPNVEISAKSGDGVSNLLDMILLVSELEDLKKDDSLAAEGVIIESNLDPKRGVTATLILKNGTLSRSDFVITDSQYAVVRSIENDRGQTVNSASASSPVLVTGLKELPPAGTKFKSAKSKKEAENIMVSMVNETSDGQVTDEETKAKLVIPIVIKADFSGTLEAIKKEVKKLETEETKFQLIESGVGDLTENNIKLVARASNPIIIGFKIKPPKNIIDLIKKFQIEEPKIFDVIYDIKPYLEQEIIKRTPKEKVLENIGRARIIRIFNDVKGKQIIGGEVLDGSIILNKEFKLVRQKTNISEGKILNLQEGKTETKEVVAPHQFGAMVSSKMNVAEGDIIEVFKIVEK